MKFTNETAHAAQMLRNGSPRDDRMMGCVIARCLFEVEPDGRLTQVAGERWPIDPSPVETPLGRTPGDKPFYAAGLDVLLGGRVVPPDGRAATRLDVEVEVGRQFRRRLTVIGDRRWVRGPKGDLVPGAPAPFTWMPLDGGLAFGGEAVGPKGDRLPFPANPRGCGYHADAASAEGRPLPNLEHPGQLIERWSDRPVPVGVGYYPADGGLRPVAAIDHPALADARAVVLGKGGSAPPAALGAGTELTVEHLTPALFNQAHPDMVIEVRKAPLPGERVRLSHGRADGSDLTFTIPAPSLHVCVQLDERLRVLPMHLDQVGLVGGASRAMLSYRVVFEYRVVRGERRFATLHAGPPPEAIPASYRQETAHPWPGGYGDEEREEL